MGRSILAWILSLSIALPSYGLTPQQTKTVQGFLKESGLAANSVAWTDLYEKFEKDLPIDVQREMKLFLKQHHQARVPKLKVSKLGSGTSEVVQLEIAMGKEKTFVQISGKNEIARITGRQGKQKYDFKLRWSDLRHSVRLMISLSVTTAWTEQVPTVQILTQEQVKVLGAKQRQQYIDRLRDVLQTAEKLQNSMPGRKAASREQWIWQQVVHEALASEPGPVGACIVAGWVGEYKNGSCSLPADGRGEGCAKCNPEIYGGSAPCLSMGGGKLPLNATEQCNQKTEATKYAVFQGVKSNEDVKNKLASLSGVLTGLREKCTEIQAGIEAGSKLADQGETCANLQNRIGELEKTQCQILEQQRDQFPDLKCQQPVSPPAAPPQGAVEPPPVPPVHLVESGGNCLNLPTSQAQLSCQGSQVRTIQCADGGEPRVSKYYCQCASSEEAIRTNSILDTGCRAASSARAESSGRRERPKKEESWFKPWMGVAAATGLMILFGYWVQREQIRQAYSVWNSGSPVATPVPVTPTNTVVQPVDVTRPEPVGGTR